MTTRTGSLKIGKGSEKPAHVGGKRTGNNRAITSTEKTPKGPKSKGGFAPTYFGNSRDCKSSE